MAAIANLSAVLNLLTGGGAVAPELIPAFKVARVAGLSPTAPVVGRWTSLWTYDGSPSAGAAPGSPGGNTTAATVGGLRQADPTGGRQKWLLGMDPGGNAPGTLLMYDRLAHRSGMSGIVTTAQTVALTPSRYNALATSPGNQIWVEIYTAIGGTATTITASYTNEAGVAGRTTPAVAIGGATLQETQRLIRLPLQSGDSGVLSVASITLVATTGAAGNIGVTIARPWVKVPYVNGFTQLRDMIAGFPNVLEVLAGACIAFAWFPNNTTVPEMDYHVVMVEN